MFASKLATRASWFVPLCAALMGCPGGTMMEPPIEPGPTDCPAANLPNVPIIGARVDRSVETYIPFDHGATTLGIDYVSAGVTRTDRVEVSFDFDPLVPVPNQVIEGDCVMGIPYAPFLAAVPAGQEEVVTANVLMSNDTGARAGRMYVSTGTSTIEIPTDALDAGDPANGAWFALFEPAHGRGRIMLAPARLDRSTFTLEGVPSGTPGIVALIQLPNVGVQTDAATRVIYVEGGIGQTWRRAARAWHQLLFTAQPAGLVTLHSIVPTGTDFTTVHSFGNPPVLANGAQQNFRVFQQTRPHETTFNIVCDVATLEIESLEFVELSVGPEASAIAIAPGEAARVEGACIGAATSWPLVVRARSLNGREGSVMFRRVVP